MSVNFRMNLWSCRFSQNMNQKLSGFLLYSIQGRNPDNFSFIFWWLHKFILKFNDLYGKHVHLGQHRAVNSKNWNIENKTLRTYHVGHQWSRRPTRKISGAFRGWFLAIFGKKDQICGIFSCKQTLHKTGNITNLVFLPETHCYIIDGTLGIYLKLNAT